MPENIVNAIDGATFLVSDRRGNVRAESEERRTDGLFYRDMRHLSTFELVIEGGPVELLSTNDTDYHGASFFLAVDTGAQRRFYRRLRLRQTIRRSRRLNAHQHRSAASPSKPTVRSNYS